MNISNYTSFFHDGSILKITHKNNKIEITMESAELSTDEQILNNNNRISGILHIEEISSYVDDKGTDPINFKMHYESAEIFRFKLNENKIVLKIIWNTVPQAQISKDFSVIELSAKEIRWENLPNTTNPTSSH